jgi:hypothetical protein
MPVVIVFSRIASNGLKVYSVVTPGKHPIDCALKQLYWESNSSKINTKILRPELCGSTAFEEEKYQEKEKPCAERGW